MTANMKLYVGNLAPATTAQDLRALFSRAGTVTSVTLLGDNDGADSKSFAHVTMATPAAAQRAIDRFHNTELVGSRLAVTFAQLRERPSDYQSRLSAFGPINRGLKIDTLKPKKAPSVFQSSLSAFGSGKSAPTPPRRRGGSQRR